MACATVPVGANAMMAAPYTDPGSAPSLALGANGFELVDISMGGALTIQPLATAGAAQTPPFTAGPSTTPVITSRTGGYAVGFVNGSGGIAAMYLDSTGTVGQEQDSFAANVERPGWLDMYVPLDITGTPSAAASAALSVNWDDNPHALTAVADGLMLVSTVGTPFTTLQVVHLPCP